MHRAQYELTNQTVGNVERVSNRRRTDTDPPAPAAEGVQWSLNPRMRGLMQHVIRTDKVAAIHIGQGAGEDYTGVDVDHSTNPPTTLRAYPEYRNLTHDETRYLLFAPAALGIRGALWWQGTTWMAGTAAAHQHVADPGYQLVGPRDAQGNVMLNSLGEPIHPAQHSNTMTAQQKFRIDRASAEFRNYLPILMNEALDGRVSTSSHLAADGWHNADVVTSLHLDSATGRYWLFVVNMSDRTFENLAISVAGIPNSLHVAPVGPDDWINGRVTAQTLREMERADGTVRFTTPLTGFDVRIFVFTAFRPTLNRSTREIKGELAWANQRKLVVYPTHRPDALGSVPDSTSDSVRYHLVYMRSDCDTCGPQQSQHRVYYRRSQPMSEYSSRSNVEWEPLEHALSTAVVDHRDSAEPKSLDSSLTCGYPSIVVRYDSLLGRSRVHVVYACHSANPTDMVFQHIETGEEGTIRIVEHVFDADAPALDIVAGEVIGAAYGNTIHDYGFPVIGAGTQRNGYVWSCRDRGIVAGMKPSNEVTFSQANPFWAITGSNANGVGPVMNDNHPGMSSYALPTNGTDEFPFVWTSGAMSSQVN